MIKKTLIVMLLFFAINACKKDKIEPEDGSSQLWVKVDQTVPDFTLSLKCADINRTTKDYTVTWQNQTLSPNLKVVENSSAGSSSGWVQVYRSFDRSDEITVQLSNGKTYRTRGFEFREKRVIEIVSTLPGSLSIVDHDISIIEKTVWVE
jgi:hypothetical protein